MFFELSKTAGAFLSNPGNLFFLVLLAGVVLLWVGARRIGRALATLALLFGVLVATVPAGRTALLVLEDRFPVPDRLPARVDGVVVLGGMIDPFVTRARGQLALGGAVERLLAFAEFGRRYPDAKLVFSGGSGVLGRQDATEAEALRPHLAWFGLDPARVVFEGRSRNTHENATLTRDLLQPAAGESWVLITSAFHMPRAVGAFRRAGWTVIPYPVDYMYEPNPPMTWGFEFLSGFSSLHLALHEWTGLAVYWLTGRTDALLPAPAP
ncbi:MAG: YdcF family protein [Alphaproteobacteria bacterium]|nr:YdcF family protein [Alphaproteobacteria bacterium]